MIRRLQILLFLLAAFIGGLPSARASLPALRDGLAVSRPAVEAVEAWELVDVQSYEDYAGTPFLVLTFLELPDTSDALSPVAIRAGPETHTRVLRIAVSYFGYRHYHPRTKQWISRDPIGEAGGLNLFSYCNNDPINGVDILGLSNLFFPHTWGIKNSGDSWYNFIIPRKHHFQTAGSGFAESGRQTWGIGERVVGGVKEAGLTGSDMIGFGLSSWADAGEYYDGRSLLFQAIADDPSQFGTAVEFRNQILVGTGKEVVNIGSLGLYRFAEATGESFATGNFESMQDRALQGLLLSTHVKGLQTRNIVPLRAYRPGPYRQLIADYNAVKAAQSASEMVAITHRGTSSGIAAKLAEGRLPANLPRPNNALTRLFDHPRPAVWVSEGTPTWWNRLFSGMVGERGSASISFKVPRGYLIRPAGLLKRWFGRSQRVIEQDVPIPPDATINIPGGGL